MTVTFHFEADFANSLRCIPMQVRFKLDQCGVKLKLLHWRRFSASERQQLLSQPCESPAECTAYQQYLQALVVQYMGEPAAELAIAPSPPWLEIDTIPASVQAKAEAVGVELSLAQWVALAPIQRFALLKLSRPSHENHNFLPALQEFQLVPGDR
ncbi:MAG: nitrate reductase maturation protein NarM [Spirulinaceae cyanobacterium SM2_1_0]|nr:nitrate reductase maturation protein NarM [Spirulinaceae cyanobacterium SM2_1_0]